MEESGKKWQGFGFGNTAFSALGEMPSVSFPGQILPTSSIQLCLTLIESWSTVIRFKGHR